MPENLKTSAVATGLEKVSFHSNPKERQCQRMLKLSPGKGKGNLLQYSCLENPVDRGAWLATVHRVTKSWTSLEPLSRARASSCQEVGTTWFFSSCGGILELRWGSQPSPWVGPGKPNLPLGWRGKAWGCARVTSGPKRPHLGVCP